MHACVLCTSSHDVVYNRRTSVIRTLWFAKLRHKRIISGGLKERIVTDFIVQVFNTNTDEKRVWDISRTFVIYRGYVVTSCYDSEKMCYALPKFLWPIWWKRGDAMSSLLTQDNLEKVNTYRSSLTIL